MNASVLTLTVPATRGQMGETQYYTTNLPLRTVVKFFEYDPATMSGLRPEDRHQRELKKNRVPEIARYIVDNDDYIFSSITVSVDAQEIKFVSSDIHPDLGVLELPMDAQWIVNDGQHRVAGVAQALAEHPERENDHLSVVILPDGGLERSQQIFSDLNRTVLKTSKSLDILFDHRDPLNIITNACEEAVPLFKDRTDKERVSLSKRSGDFATLSGIQAANAQLLADLDRSTDDETLIASQQSLAIDFWKHMTGIIEPWQDIASGAVRPAEAREAYLSSYAIVLWAVGFAGHKAIGASVDWRRTMEKLGSIDWLKTNPDWEGVCMLGGDIITRSTTRKATAQYLLWKMDLGTKPAAVL